MNPPILELELVRCFLQVAESKGFTQASKRLHLSQSAVSLKIQRLEAQLGRRIFLRTSRSLELTPEGEILAGYARHLMALNEEAVRTVSSLTRSGHLNLGVAQQFSQECLFGIMSRFRKSHPEITLSVEIGMSANLLRGLEDSSFDVVLAAETENSAPIARDGIIRESTVQKEPVRWVMAKDVALILGKDPLPLVAFPAPCGHRKRMIELLENEGKSWRISFTSPSVNAIQAAIESGWGIGVLPASLVTKGMKTIPARTIPPFPGSVISLYRRNSGNEALAHALVTFLSDEMQRKKPDRRI